MKKVFALVLALALALSMAVMASADAAADARAVLQELSATVSADELSAAVESVLADLKIPADADAAALEDGTAAATADGLIEKLGLEGTDIATKLQDAMSNDFVSFLAGLYTPGKEKPKPTVVTGDNSSMIAIGAFAALSAAAAAAFIVLKKKEA